MKYMFYRESDRDGAGDTVFFDNADEAIAYAEKEWDGLTYKEQERYKAEYPRAQFYVAAVKEYAEDTGVYEIDEFIVDMLVPTEVTLDVMQWNEFAITNAMLAYEPSLELHDKYRFFRLFEDKVNEAEGIHWDLRARHVELDYDRDIEDFYEIAARAFEEALDDLLIEKEGR